MLVVIIASGGKLRIAQSLAMNSSSALHLTGIMEKIMWAKGCKKVKNNLSNSKVVGMCSCDANLILRSLPGSQPFVPGSHLP